MFDRIFVMYFSTKMQVDCIQRVRVTETAKYFITPPGQARAAAIQKDGKNTNQKSLVDIQLKTFQLSLNVFYIKILMFQV